MGLRRHTHCRPQAPCRGTRACRGRRGGATGPGHAHARHVAVASSRLLARQYSCSESSRAPPAPAPAPTAAARAHAPGVPIPRPTPRADARARGLPAEAARRRPARQSCRGRCVRARVRACVCARRGAAGVRRRSARTHQPRHAAAPWAAEARLAPPFPVAFADDLAPLVC